MTCFTRQEVQETLGVQIKLLLLRVELEGTGDGRNSTGTSGTPLCLCSAVAVDGARRGVSLFHPGGQPTCSYVFTTRYQVLDYCRTAVITDTDQKKKTDEFGIPGRLCCLTKLWWGTEIPTQKTTSLALWRAA